jgi:hypothetical protein
MLRAFVGLLAFFLPATLLFFSIGTIFLKKLKLTFSTFVFGFFVAWIVAAVVALVIADQPTANSARESMVSASLAGSIFALIGISVGGKRKK